MRDPRPPAGFDDLPVEEQIDYVQSLWDRIAAKPEKVPVPEWHRSIIRERLAAHQASPDEVLSWEEVRASVEQAVRDRRG
ncbi:MAG TPA: addiction module protein [Polyangia bacterium]|jgi:putative addiction module component (TIGR02574 family)|nr:addiction module protein [Polyangia bacterium]